MLGKCAVCKLPCFLICGGCKLIQYCGKDHQKIHWKEIHREECRLLYRLQRNEQLGRHLVATKDIPKGQLLFLEAPLIVGPKSMTLPLCLGCHSLPRDPNGWIRCDGCGFPLCSVECQVSGYHADECRVMKEAGFRAEIDATTTRREIAYFPIVPLRCLLLREKDPDRFKRMTNLQSHLEERIDKPLYRVYEKNVAEFVTKRLGMKSLDAKDVLAVTAILDTNAFEIRTGAGASLRGLYDVASMLAHDCRPNTKHGFLSPEMTIYVSATRDISAGEVISATYTQTFWDTLSRRDHLESVKCFLCRCQRCSDPTELGTFAGAIRCVNCLRSKPGVNVRRGPYILPVDPLDSNSPWRCQECKLEMSSRQIKIGNEAWKEELSRPEIKTVPGLEGFLDKYGVYGSGVLHPNHFNVVQVKHALVRMIGNQKGHLYSEIPDDLLDRKLQYCQELMEFVDVVDPGFSRIRREILDELQATLTHRTERQFKRGMITKESAEKCLTDVMTIRKEVAEIMEMDSNDSINRKSQ